MMRTIQTLNHMSLLGKETRNSNKLGKQKLFIFHQFLIFARKPVQYVKPVVCHVIAFT